MGVDDYEVKPIERPRLLEIIDNLLKKMNIK